LEAVAVYPKGRKHQVLSKLLSSDHTEKYLFRKGKVLNVDGIEFTRKEMFCELARSFIKVELKQHDSNF